MLTPMIAVARASRQTRERGCVATSRRRRSTQSSTSSRAMTDAAVAANVLSLASTSAALADQDVLIRDANTGEIRRLLAGEGLYFPAHWSPDGSLLVYRDSRTGVNVNDVYRRFVHPAAPERRLVLVGRLWAPDQTPPASP